MEANTFTYKQRKYLQFGIFTLLGLFLLGYFLFFNKKMPEITTVKNTTVYIENSILYAFDDSTSIAQYPNRLSMHYPYLLVIKPAEKRTIIYNLDEMKKETEINEALLDYSKDGVLKNDGKSTFFNDKDLGALCDKGFIKSQVEIYCLTKINPNNVENKVISIDSNTNKKKDVYVSKNLISDFSIINDKLYIGEIDLYTKKSYVLVDELKIEAPTVISMIYQMDDKPYFASLKSELNGNTESHYLIEATVLKQENKRIYLYE